MLAKQYRLPAGTKLQHPYNISTQFFRIAIKENQLTHNRFGFAISKKIDKRAVARNRLKRVLREAVKGYIQTSAGKDMLFVVKTSFRDTPTKEIYTMVHDLLEKL